MCYFPYFRGKQFELVTVRESAAIMASARFTPIIEPVRSGLSTLARALDAVVDQSGQAIVVVNPDHGDLVRDGDTMVQLLRQEYLPRREISAGILLKPGMTSVDALELCREFSTEGLVLIHVGFSEVERLTEGLTRESIHARHVFVENYCGRIYRRHFSGSEAILLRDGFVRQRNRDYEPIERFSELHLTFEEDGATGFGDYLIVGDNFQEGGGPAYAVALHLTFIDQGRDDVMYIHHFVSERKDTPVDPAGKFLEALTKMMEVVNRPESQIIETDAIAEFRSLFERRHFPGLGYVKKLSMNHHIETLARFFDD